MALASATATSVSVTTTSETVAVSTPVLAQSQQSQYAGLVIRGNVNLTVGTNGVLATLKVRSGNTTSGAQVGNTTTETVVATDVYDLAFEVVDTAIQPSSQYCVTVTVGSASGNSTINVAEIEIDPIYP